MTTTPLLEKVSTEVIAAKRAGVGEGNPREAASQASHKRSVKVPTLLYVFLFIALRALRFEARFVVFTGLVAASSRIGTAAGSLVLAMGADSAVALGIGRVVPRGWESESFLHVDRAIEQRPPRALCAVAVPGEES